MALLDGIKKILKMCGHAFTITVHDRLETMEQRQAETDNVLLRASVRLAEQVRRSGRYEVVPSEDPHNFDPALALAKYLYSVSPSPVAAQTGCDGATWTRELAAMGYTARTADPRAGEEQPAMVRVCGAIELGESRPAVVVADLEAATQDRVRAMRGLGYRWHIVVERPTAGETGRFYANYAIILPAWSGNTIFFRDHPTFLYALQWCEGVLRQVYFGPAGESD
ncbi:MAG TPA: hypothetical protein VGR73_12130 [Bryobacteraceae bacterium]|nr:hypothetical protein [Bryobacteraceae bacterium]